MAEGLAEKIEKLKERGVPPKIIQKIDSYIERGGVLTAEVIDCITEEGDLARYDNNSSEGDLARYDNSPAAKPHCPLSGDSSSVRTLYCPFSLEQKVRDRDEKVRPICEIREDKNIRVTERYLIEREKGRYYGTRFLSFDRI